MRLKRAIWITHIVLISALSMSLPNVTFSPGTPPERTCVGVELHTGCASTAGESLDVHASHHGRGDAVASSPTEWSGLDTTSEPTAPEPCVFPCREGYTVVTLPDVTAEDLVSFRPARPTLEGEPAGLGIVGMPTNLIAEASEQQMTGHLLGWDVTVRFVPHSYVFDHGDGTRGTASTGGASWATLGQAEYTPTATTHVYRERGTYPVSVTVRYEAFVDFGEGTGGWRPVRGFVEASTGGYDVRVFEVHTALVDKTCVENPRGHGC